MYKKVFVVSVLVVSLLLTVTAFVAAQSGPDESPVVTPTLELTATPEGDIPAPAPVDPSTIPALPDFLARLAGPEGSLMIGILLSVVFNKWAWFQDLKKDQKTYVALGLTILISSVAQLLLRYVPPQVWTELEAFWLIVASGALAWLGNQGWYQGAIKPQKRQWNILEDAVDEIGK